MLNRRGAVSRRALRAVAALAAVAILPGGTTLADTADPAPVTAASAGVPGPCGRMFAWIVADPVRFHQSSTDLQGSSHALLERLAEFAFDCPSVRLRITGHTDAEGDAEYNLALSEQRAAAVADQLAALGVPRDRLVVVGAGATRPVADNGSAYGRERNRRIEFELLPAPVDDSGSAASL